MTDIVDPATRSRMMSRIRGRDTKPEMVVRRYLHAQGYRFRLHARNLPGNPDIVLPRYRAVIFVHGCFWHRHAGCKYAYNPKSRIEFWQRKFARNRERDAEVRQALRDLDWRVMVVWECVLSARAVREQGLDAISDWLRSDWPSAEYPTHASLET